ncbi:hypothetical protein JCM5350_007360 [Sporobolomyces pararoseus]
MISPTSSSSSSRHNHHTILSTLLTTRRGIIILTLSIFTIYLIFFSSPSTTTTLDKDLGGGGVKGWAREYWNKASGGGNKSTSTSTITDEGSSLGNLRQLKQEKNLRLLREKEQLAREGNDHAFGGVAGEKKEKEEWKKVEDLEENLFVSNEEEGEETERFVSSKQELNSQDAGEEDFDSGSGTRKGGGSFVSTADEIKEAALADSPRLAIEEDEAALNRAPMAAVPFSTTTNSEEDDSLNGGGGSSTSNEGTNSVNGLADHAAAKAPSQQQGHQEDNLIKQLRKPKPKPVVIAGKPKKIGTGGKVVKPEEVLLLPIEGEGSGSHQAKLPVGLEGSGGEKAGKVVQAEAGKRVGTGARPGAKGMGLERVEGIGAERRNDRRRNSIEKW